MKIRRARKARSEGTELRMFVLALEGMDAPYKYYLLGLVRKVDFHCIRALNVRGTRVIRPFDACT
jgi:hypothetical protein